MITFIGLAKLLHKILQYGLLSRFLIQVINRFLILFKNLLLFLFKGMIRFQINLLTLLQILTKAHPSFVKLDTCFRSLHLRDLYNIPRCFNNRLNRLILHVSFLLNFITLLLVLIKAHPSFVKLDTCFRSLHLSDRHNIHRCFNKRLTRLIFHLSFQIYLLALLQVLIKAHPSFVKLDTCFRSLHLSDLHNFPRFFNSRLTRLILHVSF